MMRDKKVSSNEILIDLIFKTISIQKMFFALKWVSRALIYILIYRMLEDLPN